MNTIYEPKGRAGEYSELALNLYTGCNHGCSYCFNKKTPWYKAEVFENPKPRTGILDALEKQAKKMKGDPREILLCFTCDPYPADIDTSITRDALLIMEKYELKVQILTKGGTRAQRDFDILARNGWKFGTTLHCYGRVRLQHEPNAASTASRISAIMRARNMGIYTWVSVEPVICPDHAVTIIDDLRGSVDFWKVGKMNHCPEIERFIDWSSFLRLVRYLLRNEKHMIKKDLLQFEGK